MRGGVPVKTERTRKQVGHCSLFSGRQAGVSQWACRRVLLLVFRREGRSHELVTNEIMGKPTRVSDGHFNFAERLKDGGVV